jgi:polyhydroxyalkanoate synthase
MTQPISPAEPVSAVAAPLDLLLTQAALGARPRGLPTGTAVRFARALASRPRRVVARVGTLTAEMAHVVAGTSTVSPSRRDKRFVDPAWTDNPLLRRLVQAYLVAGQSVEGLAQDVPLDWRDRERVGFAVSNLVGALAPSNNPLTSPVAWKAAIDTGGLSVLRGGRNLARDLSTAPRVPAMVDRSAFTVGTDLAATPGAVVLRTPLFELIQYAPTTETVRREPLLIVPPTINKYYVLDLRPGRSLIEHLVASGQQVFVVSWRNPDARHSKWGLDAYVQAVLDAMAAVRSICDVDSTHLMAACSGGILSAIAASHLALTGNQDPLASLTMLVTVLDQQQAGTAGALVDEQVAEPAIAASRRKGYLDGRQLAELFAWLRPQDLIWNYVVNNYLQGKQPSAFDILAWNADTTRMTARLHADFIRLTMSNGLVRPGGANALGHDIDLRKVTVDSYVVAGVADHLCPWQSCFRSAQLLGGATRFILSTNGHIAALVNPPGGKSSFVSSEEALSTSTLPQDWQEAASLRQGSWWDDYVAWLTERCKEEVPAPTELGSGQHRVLEAAPGSYVLDA